MTERQYQHVTLRPGVVLNRRTLAMLRDVERRTGKKLTILQGSYNPGGVAASAGVHDGGGAVDVWLPGMALRDADRLVVHPMRQVGFDAWYRPELWVKGKRIWGAHVHAVARGDRDLSAAARAQVTQAKAGLDGLADHKPDTYTGPKVGRNPWGLVKRRVRVRLAQRDLDAWIADHQTKET